MNMSLKHLWAKKSSYEASFSNKTKICDFFKNLSESYFFNITIGVL